MDKRTGKANKWGILMAVTMLFTTSFIGYPLMRKFILPGIVIILISGFMAFRQIKKEGWP